jgi:hypothetical protein
MAMFKISAIGPQGHTLMARNTPTEALRKALELRGAGFANVRIGDRKGLLHAPETFERLFVQPSRGEGDRLLDWSPGPELLS